MRKALATLGVLAVLMFGSAIMTGCEKSSDDSGSDSSDTSDTTTSPDSGG